MCIVSLDKCCKQPNIITMMYLLLTRFENAQIRGKIPLDARIHFTVGGGNKMKQLEIVISLSASQVIAVHSLKHN